MDCSAQQSPQPRPRISARRQSLTFALLLSLLIHALLLSLTVGGQGWGLPGFSFPWQQRRAEAPDLRMLLIPAREKVAAAAVVTAVEPWQATSTTATSAVGEAPPAPATESITSTSELTVAVESTSERAPEPALPPQADVAPAAAPAPAALPPEAPSEVGPATPTPPTVMAVEQTDMATWVVAPAASAPITALAVASAASSPEAAASAPTEVVVEKPDPAMERVVVDPLAEEAQRQALLLEAERLESERKEVARQEAQRVESARLEAERQQVARQELARQESARQEAQRIESARVETERQQAARQQAAREEAARQEAARQESERQQVARQEAARQEAARQEAGHQEAARAEAARDDARREASRRAMGRQLDEEVARRAAASEAANLASRLEPSSRGARRGRLFGRIDPNSELVLYAEAWARKIELNMTVDRIRDVAKRPHTDPLVTVAIRSDGSVESVTFLLSSGVAEMDEGIRRIVESLLPYPAFPPGLAREFDVIEIRRTWVVDTAVRLY